MMMMMVDDEEEDGDGAADGAGISDWAFCFSFWLFFFRES
jgi:hypothetical protein